LDVQEEIQLSEFFISAGVGPGGIYSEFVTMLEPGGDLFDGGLFQVAGEGGLACADGVARQNKSSSVRHSRDGRWKIPPAKGLYYVALSKLSLRSNFDAYLLPDSLAERGFAVLGPQAASAVPQLARLSGEPRDRIIAWRAVHCLVFTGEAGVPALRKALNGPDVKWRAAVTNVVETFAPEVFATDAVNGR
jgi:hypothetical protein